MANKENPEELKYLSTLSVKKHLKYGFFTLLLFSFCLFTFIINRNINASLSWISIVLPLILFGIPAMFYPQIESWKYQAWQVRSQKYERHFKD